MYIYIIICLIQATRDPRFCGSVDVHSTKIIVAREATTYHRQVNRASHATRAALWSRDAWVFRAAPLHCSIVRVQCTQTRDPTRSRILRHMHARFTRSSSFAQSQATANWEAHPAEINEAPLQMNSWAAPSLPRSPVVARKIYTCIYLERKRGEEGGRGGRKIASRSELVPLLKKIFFYLL